MLESRRNQHPKIVRLHLRWHILRQSLPCIPWALNNLHHFAIVPVLRQELLAVFGVPSCCRRGCGAKSKAAETMHKPVNKTPPRASRRILSGRPPATVGTNTIGQLSKLEVFSIPSSNSN